MTHCSRKKISLGCMTVHLASPDSAYGLFSTSVTKLQSRSGLLGTFEISIMTSFFCFGERYDALLTSSSLEPSDMSYNRRRNPGPVPPMTEILSDLWGEAMVQRAACHRLCDLAYLDAH